MDGVVKIKKIFIIVTNCKVACIWLFFFVFHTGDYSIMLDISDSTLDTAGMHPSRPRLHFIYSGSAIRAVCISWFHGTWSKRRPPVLPGLCWGSDCTLGQRKEGSCSPGLVQLVLRSFRPWGSRRSWPWLCLCTSKIRWAGRLGSWFRLPSWRLPHSLTWRWHHSTWSWSPRPECGLACWRLAVAAVKKPWPWAARGKSWCPVPQLTRFNTVGPIRKNEVWLVTFTGST